MQSGIYERTDLIDGRLSPWNARAVLVDKVKNPTPQDEPRMTYNYSKVVEELPGVHMNLMSGCHDYLSDPRHGCYMVADLKHAYLLVEVHPEDRKFFAFTTATYAHASRIYDSFIHYVRVNVPCIGKNP